MPVPGGTCTPNDENVCGHAELGIRIPSAQPMLTLQIEHLHVHKLTFERHKGENSVRIGNELRPKQAIKKPGYGY